MGHKTKKTVDYQRFLFPAVRGGFEPPEQFPVRQFSKLVVSATHPPHQWGCKYKICFLIFNLNQKNLFQYLVPGL